LLKQACHEFALENAFEFNTKRANKHHYTIVCKADDCPWHLYASSVESFLVFRIKTYQSEPGNKQAMASYIANVVSEKLKEQPNYRPVDIVVDIRRELGVKINYSKGYRAREHALEQQNGTHEEAYKSLPKYCLDLEKTNPNSKAFIESTSENKFLRLFVCHGACATGFAYCRRKNFQVMAIFEILKTTMAISAN